ncbi:DUF4381 domain-containing protein [Crocosphaera chwakensis]|uniref:Putative transmembrane protein n=1 Tax=Crocosphaera chwakensis CCY0110 TaxID=391612 RepID=A3IME8_9CHRO|nr:DUF4381 domain-containing protein [Crocosphaera chwakensis]EAZ92317.1 Putative transmembrane protein [Crocosphaera chwakensis CCY0110]
MKATETLKDPNFGSYMLNGFREISLPEPPRYFPQTIGWTILAKIIFILVIIWVIKFYQYWQKNRYRRAALKRLRQLEKALQTPETKVNALKELPILLKQTALAVYPRQQVASLTGQAWLTFLESTYSGNLLTPEQGKILTQLAYQSNQMISQLSSETVIDLFDFARHWLAKHQETST